MTDFSLSLARSSENGGGVGLSPAFDSYACTSSLLSFKSLLITLFLAVALRSSFQSQQTSCSPLCVYRVPHCALNEEYLSVRERRPILFEGIGPPPSFA